MLGQLSPTDVTGIVMKSGLRGRGGAGFPTGVKWGFLPKDYQGPRYLCCNADESEPGTFKDRQLIERDPHQLLEGMLIACYAIGAASAYIYIRGEFVLGAKILEAAIKDARAAGYVGKNIFGSGVHRYLGPSRTARISAGKKQLCWNRSKETRAPRVKPPFPATHGLYNKPTVVNNVETLANLPHIVNRGAEWFAAIGSPPKAQAPGSSAWWTRETTGQL